MEQTIVKVDLKAAKRNRSREVVRRFGYQDFKTRLS